MKKYEVVGKPFIDQNKSITVWAESKKQAISEVAYTLSKKHGLDYAYRKELKMLLSI